MATPTRHHFSRLSSWVPLFAAALLLRRLVEHCCLRRSGRWISAREAAVQRKRGDILGCLVICIVPMYQELEIVSDAVRYWHWLLGEAEVSEVLLVTTAKEDDLPSSTRSGVAEALALLTPDPRLRLLHCPVVHGFRAAQLNFALEDVRMRHGLQATDTARVWVGVYNADSRPEVGTFRELRHVVTVPGPRLYQQMVDYVVPARPGVSWVATGNATLQTWWTWSHYWARSVRGNRSPGRWSATSPFSTFGHGEFARLDFLDEIGGFPDFAYADGLLLGWMARLMGEHIGLLASRDRAEVPRRPSDLLVQQRAWMRGLLSFGATVRWARKAGRLRLTQAEVLALSLEHGAIPLSWGLSTPAVACALLLLASRARPRPTSRDLATLVGLLLYPALPGLLTDEPAGGRLLLMAATCASWAIEGLAFWPGLFSHLANRQAAPEKTPR